VTDKDAKKERKYDLEERLIGFAVCATDVAEALPATRLGNHIAGQLIRCGTSPAANYAEAQSAESRSDFVHKMKITLKELREARIWMLLIERKKLLGSSIVQVALRENVELISIFNASIRTTKANAKR
jgi:four helix bundle protein